MSHESQNLFNNRFKIDELGNFQAIGHFLATKTIKAGQGIQILDEDMESDRFHIFISGMSDSPVLPPAFNNTLIFETTELENENFMGVMFWDKTTGRPSLILNQGAPARASVIERSLIIGAGKGNKPLDENYTKGEEFANLSFNTSENGADLGVENCIETKGGLFTDSINESTLGQGVSINGNFKVIDGEVYILNLAGQGNKPIQVDDDGRLYTLAN